MTPEQLADAILRAAGSGLHNYTLPSTRAAIIGAAADAMSQVSQVSQTSQGWQPIETAPKGQWVERQTGKGVAKVHVPERIIARLPDGGWTVSYWIEKDQRWNMFTKDAPPTHWLPVTP
jgi:hypothetical protein